MKRLAGYELTQKKEETMTSIKKQIFYAHDAGAAELIGFYFKEAINKNGVSSATLLGEGYAKSIFQRENLCFQAFDQSEEVLNYFREQQDCLDSLMAGTSAINHTHLFLCKAAKTSGIHSTLCIDHWMNLPQRFMCKNESVIPDCVSVIDAFCKKELVDWGINSSKIKIAGHPVIDLIVTNLSRLRHSHQHQLEVRKKVNINIHDKVNVFISEDITGLGLKQKLGFDELDSFKLFFKNISEGQCIIKVHPREAKEKWPIFLKANSFDSCILVNDEITPIEVLSIADQVGGLYSILLVQAHLAGIHTVSYQPNLSCQNYLQGSLGDTIQTII